MPSQWVGWNVKNTSAETNWNAYTSTVVGTTVGPSGIVDIDGNSVNCTLTLKTQYGGANTAGGTGDVDIFPSNVRSDSYYISSGQQDWELGGTFIDDANTYEVRIVSSRSGTGTRTGDFTIDGTTVTINAQDSTDANRVGTWTGVAPSSGIININVTLNTNYAYVNGIAVRQEDTAAAGGIIWTPMPLRAMIGR